MHHNLALLKARAAAQPCLNAANADVERLVDHDMSLSLYFQDPDGVMMELFCDTFDTQAEGLAFMRGRPSQADRHYRRCARPFPRRTLAARTSITTH